MLATEHKLTPREAEQIKQTLLEYAHLLNDPEETVRRLIAAFRAVEEATATPSAFDADAGLGVRIQE